MSEFLLEFEDKVNEINEYFDFVRLVDSLNEIGNLDIISNKSLYQDSNKSTYKIDAQLQKVLKANCFLMLYNLIEGSLRSAIDAIFIAINEENLTYKEVTNVVKRIWLQHKYKTFKTTDISNDILVEVIDNVYNDLIKIEYDKFIEKNKTNDISGNLDDRKIKTMASFFGFIEPSINCDSLALIKRQRNLLAHGRSTFSESGKIKSIQELIKIKDEVIYYLKNVLSSIDQHIKEKKYKLIP